MVILSAILDFLWFHVGFRMEGKRWCGEDEWWNGGISGFAGRRWEKRKKGNPPGKKEPSLRKNVGFGCFGQSLWSEFPMFRKFSCAPSNTAPLPQSQMQAARQRMVERFSPEKVVSQHILPLLQRWHRGPGWQRLWVCTGQRTHAIFRYSLMESRWTIPFPWHLELDVSKCVELSPKSMKISALLVSLTVWPAFQGGTPWGFTLLHWHTSHHTHITLLNIILVGGLEHLSFFHILGIVSPTD